MKSPRAERIEYKQRVKRLNKEIHDLVEIKNRIDLEDLHDVQKEREEDYTALMKQLNK